MGLGANTVPGTPRWAAVVAYLAPVTVMPAALWRTGLGLGADLGMAQAWRDDQEVPGAGTSTSSASAWPRWLPLP